jgi:hypothetical protein
MFLALYFLVWDCFGVHKFTIQILFGTALRAMTGHEREGAVMLFVIAPLITSRYANGFLMYLKLLQLFETEPFLVAKIPNIPIFAQPLPQSGRCIHQIL